MLIEAGHSFSLVPITNINCGRLYSSQNLEHYELWNQQVIEKCQLLSL
jgi:hypothetical protein